MLSFVFGNTCSLVLDMRKHIDSLTSGSDFGIKSNTFIQ